LLSEAIEGFALSPQQRRLWLVQQSNQGLSRRGRCIVSIDGAVELDTLKGALETVVSRHEILRTRYVRLPDMSIPVQVITEAGVAWQSDLDLSRGESTAQSVLIDELYELFSRSSSDVEKALEACIVTLSSTRRLLMMGMPSLSGDRAGLENLVRELGLAYEAAFRGKPYHESHIDDPIQYADLSEWQNELLEAEDTKIGREFWRKQEVLESLDLRFDFEKVDRGKVNDGEPVFTPARCSIDIDSFTAKSIARLVDEKGVKLQTFFLTCWRILVGRITARPDFVIGMLFDGRKYDDLQDAIGLFEKRLPVRCLVDERERFDDAMIRLSEAVSDAHKWQHCFAWDQTQEVQDEGSLYFPVTFSFEERAQEQRYGALSLSLERHDIRTDRVKLELSCFGAAGMATDELGAEVGPELGAEIRYDAALFDPADVELLAARFVAVLKAAAAATPTTVIGTLEALTTDERRHLLIEFNTTRAEYDNKRTLHELFESAASREPDRVAAVFEEQVVTYCELNRRANQLARYLKTLGAAPDVPIGICIERSIEMIVGVLGILKGGAAYLPLDPSYPKERLDFMSANAAPTLLLAHQNTANQLPRSESKVVFIDSDWERIAEEDSADTPSVADFNNLAYVIYTSGSTGRPKGVMITHGAIVNRILWMQQAFPLGGADAVLQKTPFSFDASVWEFFAPLSAGARLIIARPGGHQETSYIAEAITEHGVTVLQLVPSMLRAFFEDKKSVLCASLKRIFAGGEALPVQTVEAGRARLPIAINNLYGPTETAIDATYWQCSEENGEENGDGLVPIGRPIVNARTYLLNEHLSHVPAGASGELFIGGAGLARGYFARPDLTAERFVPDACSGSGGERLYRTGDLARNSGDALHFLGRIDHQVKIRGFRIELGEIESAVRSHPAISEAIVTVWTDEIAGERLAAYVVNRREHSAASNELRVYLQERLPDYMIPSVFVALDRLPLTTNGKVDRSALPPPDQARSEVDDGGLPSSTAIEEMLAGIWSRTLGIGRVGIRDNFFELGGHSLLATQVISQIREAFQVEIPLRELFNAPTVAGMAERVDAVMKAGSGIDSAPIALVSREKPLPLSFAQQRLWLVHQLAPRSPAYNLPQAVRISGSLDKLAIERSVHALVERHESLRTTFIQMNWEPLQVIAPSLTLNIPMIDLGELSEGSREVEARRIAAEEAAQPFDLSTGPLLRFSLLRLSDEDHVTLFTVHHIVFDGWSSGIFIREIAALHESFSTGRTPSLPELPIQYADFANWQRERLQGAVLETQLSYWKDQLAALPTLELPTDHPRPTAQSDRGGARFVFVSKLVSDAVQELSLNEHATQFMTLLACFDVLLHHRCRQDDIVVGTDVANRTRGETEGLIGFFINQLVLRTSLTGDPSFRELLEQVRRVTLDAYAHQDLPFDKLVETLKPERSTSLTPLFQVKIVFQNAPRGSLDVSGLSISPFEANAGAVKFDLLLNLISGPDGLAMSLMYSKDLFDEETIDQMLESLQLIIRSVVARPDIKLSELVEDLDEAAKERTLRKQRAFKESRRKGLKDFKARAASVVEAVREETL